MHGHLEGRAVDLRALKRDLHLVLAAHRVGQLDEVRAIALVDQFWVHTVEASHGDPKVLAALGGRNASLARRLDGKAGRDLLRNVAGQALPLRRAVHSLDVMSELVADLGELAGAAKR